jgi:endonuclease/exonuclease/phosphatase family metal-dependent hydrolase
VIPERERLITWNVGSRSDEVLLKALLTLVRLFNPVAFALQEVGDRASLLQRFAGESGYFLVRLDKGAHSQSVAVMIRPDVLTDTLGILRLSRRTFVGRRVAGSRDDGWTKPKWLVWAGVDFWDFGWIVASTHLTPSHQVRLVRILVRLQVAAIGLWMRTRRRTVLLGGDFNETPRSKWNLLAPLKLLATYFTGKTFGDRPIDYWWVVMARLKRRGITVDREVLDDYPSDHRPLMITLSRTMPHACPLCGNIHTG